MIKIFNTAEVSPDEILNRKRRFDEDADKIVAPILNDVALRGDEALLEYTEKFDGVKLENLIVSDEEIKQAVNECEPNFISILEKAKNNITAFHKMQLRSGFEINEHDGVVLGQKITPIERVGIYVPGGTASYPSTVLMNAIPARIAGVSQIIMVTPPAKDGKIPKNILAAAFVAGVDKIFKVGGAQAVAALAYGTKTIPAVDKIVGPGNRYVAAAKRRVFGIVNIDMIAGPSEILIIADQTASPRIVAGDMLSQAEHDIMASAVLVTNSGEFAYEVQCELERQIPMLERAEICEKSISAGSKIIVVRDLDEAVEMSNLLAPEHLEIAVDEPTDLLFKIKNAGSIFLGKSTPEALGDYLAGPNHTLPTGGTARFSSPLSVDDFIKKSSYIYYTSDALREVKDDIDYFARSEGLTAHARSVTMRFE